MLSTNGRARTNFPIVGEQSLDDGGRLKILVEKDFVCLAPREGEEDEADMFPNPRRGDL
ncbi:MAG: hypothetical protein CM1200mP36_00010 [Gammaproteobacteria bacterium]|nr:MAG: hypothetical protein CM1200mP36_00010 [Gammaproteobacteria bacterium]